MKGKRGHLVLSVLFLIGCDGVSTPVGGNQPICIHDEVPWPIQPRNIYSKENKGIYPGPCKETTKSTCIDEDFDFPECDYGEVKTSARSFQYGKNGKLAEADDRTYAYDIAGNLILVSADHVVITSEYGSDGGLSARITWDFTEPDGPDSTYKYIYAANTCMPLSFTLEGAVTGYGNYIYDAHDRLVTKEWFSENKGVADITTYDYLEQNNIIIQSGITDNGTRSWDERTYIYSLDGRLLSEGDTISTQYDTYEYTPDGDLNRSMSVSAGYRDERTYDYSCWIDDGNGGWTDSRNP